MNTQINTSLFSIDFNVLTQQVYKYPSENSKLIHLVVFSLCTFKACFPIFSLDEAFYDVILFPVKIPGKDSPIHIEMS